MLSAPKPEVLRQRRVEDANRDVHIRPAPTTDVGAVAARAHVVVICSEQVGCDIINGHCVALRSRTAERTCEVDIKDELALQCFKGLFLDLIVLVRLHTTVCVMKWRFAVSVGTECTRETQHLRRCILVTPQRTGAE